jgi:hypothetical protein
VLFIKYNKVREKCSSSHSRQYDNVVAKNLPLNDVIYDNDNVIYIINII